MQSFQNRGTSVFFKNYQVSSEQQVLESLIIESIKRYGEDMYYVPREITSVDTLFNEDDQSEYNRAFPIEMYIKSVDGFQGDGEYIGKLGLVIADQVTFTVAKRIFNEEVGSVIDQERPNEGDLVYFPLNEKLFQIKYVNYKPFFYQLGALYTYDLICENFTYSSQVFNTGYDFIDRIQGNNSENVLDYYLKAEDGSDLLDEEGENILSEDWDFDDQNTSINDEIQERVEEGTETDKGKDTSNNNIIDFSEFDPFSGGKY